MRRIACVLLCLALCCALFACGKPAPVAPTAEETTAAVSPEKTSAFLPESGEEGEIRWRTMDLDDAENAEIKQWLLNWQENRQPEQPGGYPMADGKTVSGYYPIILKEDGRRTKLLEPRYLGDGDPELDETAWIYPSVLDVIDERYFVFHWGGWEWIAGTCVYDTKEMREIPIQWDEKTEYGNSVAMRYNSAIGDSLYLVDGGHGPYGGPLHLMRADLSQLGALKPGDALKAVDVFAGIPHEPASEVAAYELTPDARWFFVTDRIGLYLFDLQKKTLTTLRKTDLGVTMQEDWEHHYFLRLAMRDERTLYWFTNDESQFENYAVEITLA